MHLETTTFERAIHLLLFVAGGIAFATAALVVLERFTGGEGRAIKLAYVAASAGVFVALAVFEALYHLAR